MHQRAKYVTSKEPLEKVPEEGSGGKNGQRDDLCREDT